MENKSRRVRAFIGVSGCAALVALGAGAGAFLPGTAEPALAQQQLPAPPANGEMGFVFNVFAPAIYHGKDDCPNGLAGTVRENYLATLPAAEQARLNLKENEEELTRRWKTWTQGPDKTNICSNPEMFSRSVQRTVQGKTSYGLNLDGQVNGAAENGCQHEDFTGVGGEAGVDNQLYRAMGCSRIWRGVEGTTTGEIYTAANHSLETGEHTIVMLLRGVDSLKDDDSVEVILASSDDRPVLDSRRNFIAKASFTIASNPRWRNVLKGHIHDGVLTTDPQDIKLNRRQGIGGKRGERAEHDLRQGRFRLTLKSDGAAEGVLGAYQIPLTLLDSMVFGGSGTATVAGIDCAAQLTTLLKLADGIKDPVSGKCTAVSSALNVAAVPAFVIDRPELAGKSGAAR
ncbi:hypothetical protein KRR38_00820 [Novosphingobium sp. G106]|uniref:hypothetical protein n=1 Tax=Novosphingobium sp. G106 TaxID=2849500 RepID=UPI001C2D1104|nr:hypothetical protein [Novosphingobium sp. G106]MBV1686248.1 hypothetical protein [Novosphingobium sp. G106]